MKQVLLREGRAVVEEVPAPAAEAGRVLVRTAFSVLSAGTERVVLAATEGASLIDEATSPQRLRRAFEILRDEGPGGVVDRLRARRAGPPEAAPGYAAAGVVQAVGKGVADLPPGTAVACAGAGYASHAEMIAVPRNLVVPVPPGVALEEAAFTTIGAIAMQGVRRAGLQVGECAVVLGLGLVGQLAAQILRASGVIVVGFDADRGRADGARAIGFDAWDLASRDPRDEVPRLTGGLLADAVVVCAASKGSEVTNLALRLCRRKGRVVLVGDVGLGLERALLYEKEIDVLMSTSYGPGRYDPEYEEKGIDYPPAYVRWTENRNMAAFLRLVADGRVRLRPLIDRVLPLDEAGAAYDLIAGAGADRPLGVVLRYRDGEARPAGSHAIGGSSPEPTGPPAVSQPSVSGAAADPIDPLPAGTATIGVALCGAGAFVKAAHLPALRAHSAFAVGAAIAATPVSARDTARRHSIPRAATRLADVLDDPAVQLVLVGTRHHLHAAQAREALHAGRHVLVEKPLCLDEGEIAPLLETARNARRMLAVGFNRRYSPLVLRAREVLARLEGPMVATYRVNAGALPPGHWALDPGEGGGRILGECCHFVDLLLHLVGAPLTFVEARALPSDGNRVVRSDSFVATLGFADGSRAALVYTGLGDPGLAKERIEIFRHGAALVIDDFTALAVHGGPGGSLTLPRQDKGIAGQWDAVARRLRGEPSDLITLAAIEAAMRGTFRLDRAVRGRDMRILMWEHFAPGGPIRVAGHHLAERFLRRGDQVAWCAGPVTPLNLVRANDESRSRLRLWRTGGAWNAGRLMFACAPMTLLPHRRRPLLDSRFVAARTLRATLPSFRRAMEAAGFGEPDILFMEPGAPLLALLDLYPRARAVYRMCDDTAEFPDTPRSFAAIEREVCARVDLVVATAPRLARRAAECGARRHLLLPNACDPAPFAPGMRPEPADLAALPRPRAIYAGSIESWFDAGLVAAVARRLPRWSFVLVGPARGAFPELQGLANVHLIGPRPYDALPGYFAAADAALVPFRLTPMTHAIHPIKVYEYLAAGLPVVSTAMDETRAMRAPIALAADAADFAAALETARVEDGAGARAARIAFARRNSWDDRFATLVAALGLDPARAPSAPGMAMAMPRAAAGGMR